MSLTCHQLSSKAKWRNIFGGIRKLKVFVSLLLLFAFIFCYNVYFDVPINYVRNAVCDNSSLELAINISKAKLTLLICDEPSEEYHCLCYSGNGTDDRCAMTIGLQSRLGNNMGEYAALYALSILNRRPAFMISAMADVLQPYFKLTMPVISKTFEDDIKWTDIFIHDYMEDRYANFEGRFIRLLGTPYSWKFYHFVADDIRREFTFQDEITNRVESRLQQIKGNRSSVTFIGVHARRGDYVTFLAAHLKGVVANEHFFAEATNRFRERFSDAVFVVVSDDMPWCREHISNALGDVHYVGNNDQLRPIDDLAILSKCNHTIFSIGSFGYWAGFLAGGQTIYLSNYTLPDSPLNNHLHFESVFWPHWESIDANLSDFGH
ncbi:fucosyltransferase 1 (galactoside 2-alpha-L-fucosyltransferase, H blood group) [Chamberlinius hualienensis]